MPDSEINVVIFAPKPQAESAAARLPSCNDPAMLKAVAEKVKEYQDENPASSIISRRKQALIVKNLKEFEEIPAAEFDNASNYEVARELVMTKINYRIAEDNLRLCRGGAVSGIYLLMYPEGNGTRVQILNFVPAPDSGNEFSIYFEPPADGETPTEEKASEPARTPDADTASGPGTGRRFRGGGKCGGAKRIAGRRRVRSGGKMSFRLRFFQMSG